MQAKGERICCYYIIIILSIGSGCIKLKLPKVICIYVKIAKVV